ncbi:MULTISPECIES: holin [Streptomycetaceae]|uniref:Uncharacterized protein n=1 Tax=Streptantibioticus cattleyicolor (strain ATCC 35852 / DSM 46488 / JCM 4925 / NBRC 14057 / NRRL 8057) TaxID=1003195 RepID=F8JXB4_STREN|nr:MULTISPECIES: holin [Streptomycetaceae]AEW94584.1 hypothetical protein SCATT_22130 [Streptantibioticus cattleyicolor NRRL 8057 = DSM 46488]MYS59222.1 hypothetical protein [Streptomyces sp. SID5468]CCB74942.1 protein of unknown function [Streptantibioticus cattleyicolor NRRL 8057 = DSM 46488]
MNRRWLDLGERTVATYVQAVCGLLLADATGLMSLGALRAAAVAALPAAFAVIKSALALGLGPSGTASLLPPAPPSGAAAGPEAIRAAPSGPEAAG